MNTKDIPLEAVGALDSKLLAYLNYPKTPELDVYNHS